MSSTAIKGPFGAVEAEAGDHFTSIAGIKIARLVDLDALGYRLKWGEQNITDQVVAGASLAGHIALHNPIEPGVVTFYDSCGSKLFVLQLPEAATDQIKFMCWNNAMQHLIILTASGRVFFRHSTGQRQAASDVQLPSAPVAFAPSDHGLCVCVAATGGATTTTTASSSSAAAAAAAAAASSRSSYELIMLSCTTQFEDYTVKRFTPARGMAQPPDAMVVIPSTLSQSNCDETYVVVNQQDSTQAPRDIERIVWRSSRASAAQFTAFSTPFEVSDAIACMRVAPDGRSIAMLLMDGTVLCARPDFRECKVVGQALDVSGLGYQFEWFGNEIIALINHSDEDYFGTLFSVRFARGADGGDAKSVDMPLPHGSWAIVEPDGLRLVSGRESRGEAAHRFWQVIPSEVIAFYQRVTSKSAASCTQLRVAYNAFRNGDASCASIIKALSAPGATERLVQAISDTLQVACYEWDPERQRDVLRVASYGKVFCQVFDSQKFYDVCRRARVSHALRTKANIIASLHQLRLLDGEPLINRLINIGELSLACDVAAVLGLRNDSILERWSELTVQKAGKKECTVADMRQFVEGLFKRGTFNLDPSINAAVDASLPREALADLIRLERRTDKQMHYYLSNSVKYPEFAEFALMGASMSGDSDVLFDCLMQVPLSRELLNRMPDISANLDATAAMLVRFSPSAVDTDPRLSALSSVLNEHDPFFPVSLCLQQYFLETARLQTEVKRGLRARVVTVLGTVRSSIGGAAIAMQHAAAHRARVGSADASTTTRGMDASTKETVQRLEQQDALIKEQQGLYDQTQNEGFLNASIAKTLALCVQLDLLSRADAIAQQFGVSKKMLAWARLKGAIARGTKASNFDAAYRLIDAWFSKECVFGYASLVQALVDAEQPQFAALFIKKVATLEERLEFYVKCKKWREAAEDCKKEGAMHYGQQLRSRAGGDSVALNQIAAAGL